MHQGDVKNDRKAKYAPDVVPSDANNGNDGSPPKLCPIAPPSQSVHCSRCKRWTHTIYWRYTFCEKRDEPFDKVWCHHTPENCFRNAPIRKAKGKKEAERVMLSGSEYRRRRGFLKSRVGCATGC